MKNQKTWVLVADAGHARVLIQSSHEPALSLVEGLDIAHPIPKSADMVRDSLPRTFDSAGPNRHAIAPRQDPHRAEKKSFAKELAHILDTGLADNAFDKLVIIAPPQMLGDLRPHLSDTVRKKLEREMHLDLSKAPIDEIARRLDEARAA